MKKYLYLILFFLVCVPAIAGTINSYTLKSPPDSADTVVIYDSDDGSTKKAQIGDISGSSSAGINWTAYPDLTALTNGQEFLINNAGTSSSINWEVLQTQLPSSSGGINWSSYNDVTTAANANEFLLNVGGTSKSINWESLQQISGIDQSVIFNVKQYGAKGDGILLFDGTITSGTDDFTSASATFTSADVGKVITIRGAAGTNVDLTTTISAYVNANSVTLTDNASATVSGDQFTYGTDDTTALRAVMTAIGTNSTIGKSATMFFPAGTYIVNGAFDQSNSSQIAFPLNAFANSATTITIKGATASAPNQIANNGSIIFGTRNGSAGTDSILSVTDAGGGGTGNIARINAVFENIRFRTVQDPYHTAVNLEYVDQAQGLNVIFDTASDGSALPTHSGSYALKLPGVLAGNVSGGWTNLKIKNYRNGVRLGEHSVIKTAFIVLGVNALVFNDCRYPAQVFQVSVESVQNPVVVTSTGSVTSYFRIHDLDLEHNSGTFATVYDILDTSNLGVGDIYYSIFDNGGGTTLLKSGGKNISLHSKNTNQMEFHPVSGDHFSVVSGAADSSTSGGIFLAKQNDYTAVDAGTRLGGFGFAGSYSTTGTQYVYGATMQAIAAEAFTASAAGTHMQFRTTPTGSATLAERMRITSQGNVGIGTTNPTQIFQIGTAAAGLQVTSTGGLISAGNVGISTTAPTTCGCKQYTNGLCTTVGTCS